MGIVSFQTGRGRGGAMSALGHKRTFAPQNVMSALHPKADSECPRVGGSLAVSPKIKVQLAGLMPLGVTYREITCDDKIKGRAKDIVT